MAKAPQITKIDSPESPAAPDVDLKDPVVAAVLAWLLPGLGHWYQGRSGKAVLYLVCIFGTFCFGMYLGNGRVVYASFRDEDWRLPYICQIGVGAPALPAVLQSWLMKNGKQPILNGFMAPPRHVNGLRADNAGPDDLDNWNRSLGRYFELGTVYTMIAGLLNILAIYDAYGGPAFVPGRGPPKKKEEENNPSSA